jgi:hypothetical protein
MRRDIKERGVGSTTRYMSPSTLVCLNESSDESKCCRVTLAALLEGMYAPQINRFWNIPSVIKFGGKQRNKCVMLSRGARLLLN